MHPKCIKGGKSKHDMVVLTIKFQMRRIRMHIEYKIVFKLGWFVKENGLSKEYI